MVQYLEKQDINIINIDESAFNSSSNINYGWVKKGESQRNMIKQAFTSITLVAGVDMKGNCYYQLVRGSHNQHTFAIYLAALADRLDSENQFWWENTILLIDNHKLHLAPAVIQVRI